jgi:hypothetical protein
MRLFFFQVTEYTLVMKCVTQLMLVALIFGVYSVSSHSAYSYPASRSSFSTSSALESDSVRLTRSSRDANRSEVAPIASKKFNENLSPLAPGTHNLSVGVGQVFLMGNLSTGFENSLGTQVHYTYGVSDMFSFESDFGYSSHSQNTLSQGSFSLVNLNAGLRTNLVYFDQLIPFASLGLGFYRPSTTFTNNSTLSALLFGMQFGGGVDLVVSKKVFLGTRLAYHNMFNSSKVGSDGSLHEVGGSFISFMIHAGVTF